MTRMDTVMQGFVADCQVTARFAERLGLGEDVSAPLEQKFARWDGKGVPAKLAGGQIAIAARILALSWRTEAQLRLGGYRARPRTWSGTPGRPWTRSWWRRGPVVPAILEGLDEDSWEGVVGDEPERPPLTGPAHDAALEALGDFADLKSPWFAGHSRAVAELAEAAAWRAGLAEPEVAVVRRAALVHALGRTGVPNTIWDKPGSLTVGRAGADAAVPVPHRPDPAPRQPGRAGRRGLPDPRAPGRQRLPARRSPPPRSVRPVLLAAAHVYQSLCEPRPHRAALAEEEAATHLRDEVRDGRLDAEAVEAVLASVGHPSQRHERAAPADLTPREVDVLRLIARGADLGPGRHRARHPAAHRRHAHRAHLREDRRLQPLRRDAVRDGARPGLSVRPSPARDRDGR